MNDKQKVIARIQKLLALSKSPNENEAMSAAAKAQALLASQAAVDALSILPDSEQKQALINLALLAVGRNS